MSAPRRPPTRAAIMHEWLIDFPESANHQRMIAAMEGEA